MRGDANLGKHIDRINKLLDKDERGAVGVYDDPNPAAVIAEYVRKHAEEVTLAQVKSILTIRYRDERKVIDILMQARNILKPPGEASVKKA